MSAIFSVQNLQTFLRRKNLRPPSRGGPPGPDRPPPPPNRGRSPEGRNSRGPSPAGRSGRSVGALVSSVITLLNQWPVILDLIGDQWPVKSFGILELASDHRPLSLRRCWSFRCRRRRRFFRYCRRHRAHFLLRVAQLLDLVQTLLLFVDAHGEVLDHWLSNAQTALQFMHHRASALNRHQNVEALTELAHHVRQTPFAHAIDTLDRTSSRSHGGLQVRNQLLEIFVRHIRPDNKHQFISTIHT